MIYLIEREEEIGEGDDNSERNISQDNFIF